MTDQIIQEEIYKLSSRYPELTYPEIFLMLIIIIFYKKCLTLDCVRLCDVEAEFGLAYLIYVLCTHTKLFDNYKGFWIENFIYDDTCEITEIYFKQDDVCYILMCTIKHIPTKHLIPNDQYTVDFENESLGPLILHECLKCDL